VLRPATRLTVLIVAATCGLAVRDQEPVAAMRSVHQTKTAKAAQPAASTQPANPAELDRLFAPIALHPDALLGQMLLCAANPGKVGTLREWMHSRPGLKGSQLQDAAAAAGFEPSYVVIVVFPQVVDKMADDIAWTTKIGEAFATDRSSVFASIQRLRSKARDAGKLKTSSRQEVETRTTSSGEQVITIEPANPQVVYVPQYNPQTVYTTSPSSTTVVIDDDDDAEEAVAAGLIGFTAGVALGAAFDNSYYYGPYGWYGGGYMYNDAWDDYYDHREDAREDWMDHREDIADERGDRSGDAREQRTDRQQNRQENRSGTQTNRDQRQADRAGTSSSTRERGTVSQESRGFSGERSQSISRERSGTRSDAFSGYSSGRSQRSSSSRGQRSRSSSRGGRR
jgi:hypothetical protein